MTMQLNLNHDFEAKSAELARKRHVVIPDFLELDSAERAYTEISTDMPWELAINTAQGPAAIDAEKVRQADARQRYKLMEGVRQQAVKGFSFIYGRYDLIPGEPEKLIELQQMLKTEETLSYFRKLTGAENADRLDAHATMYQQGFFLKNHNDIYAGKNRLYAYVIGLTKNWQADWGGLLHFLDDAGEIAHTIVPRFNTLCVFEVPQDHFVSMVANYTTEARLAVTGWLFAPGDHTAR